MNKEEIDILYSFANDEDCRYVYDWQGFNYEEICHLIDKLIKENKKLKKLLANNGIVSTCENCEDFGVCPHSYREYDYKCELDKVTIQQKAFIQWLEDYINLFDKKDIYEEGSCDMLEEILNKYRSIIGDDK